MSRQSILKTIYIIFFLVITVAALYYLYTSAAKADPIVGEYGDKKILDFADNTGQKPVFVRIVGKDGEIIIKRSIISWCSYKLSGFENEVKINSLVDFGSGEKLIEVAGPVGIHAENRQYFYLDLNLCPQPIIFAKNNVLVYNVYSDQPSFKLLDFDSDGYLDIGAEYRNYDKNPLVDGIRDIYLFEPKNRNFNYSRSEKFVQETSCLDCAGEVK